LRLIYLYRPRLPGLRAQAIGVVHTAHALAVLGHEITVLADASGNGDGAAALAQLGLLPHPGLHLRISPVEHATAAGAWFRTQLARWWAGAPGVVLARDKRRLVRALRWLPQRHRVVLETHELDSGLAADKGEDPAPWLDLETQALRAADAVIANCGGTLEAWHEAHGDRVPAHHGVAHNGTAPDRQRPHARAEPPVIRYVGSLRPYKGLDTLFEAASSLPGALELVGGSPEERERVPAHVRCAPSVPYGDVPDLLASAAALVLPLADNRFGRSLSSPLKLWDYLATQTPIVAADVPSVHEIAGMMGARLHLYTPGDPPALMHAVRAAMDAPPRASALRTWADRAAEIDPFLREPA
jgi:glycosyltransferase involved in cell wall biosynthesis